MGNGIFKKITVFICLILIVAGSIGMAGFIGQEESLEAKSKNTSDYTAYVVPVENEIERGLQAFLERAFNSARDENADLIVLDLNTPGGTLEAAFEIRDLIVEENIPIYAYVNPDAISAGAYLALAADGIYVRSSGSYMGAAEARMGPEKADEKVMSYWESRMRDAAELNDRDPDIAAAMVRSEMEIDGLVEENELLTMSGSQALEHGMADGEVDTYEELFAKAGFENAQVEEYGMEWAERLARFFTNPAVASILLTLGMAGLIIEITSPGLGVPGLLGLISFGLFFGGHIFAGLAGYEVLLLFVAGVILLIVEAIMAGFGIFGIVGIISFGFAIVLSAESTDQGLMILLYSLLGTIIVLAVAFRYFVRTRFWDRIILRHSESREQGYVGTNIEHRNLKGEVGVTETPLRPAGTAKIAGRRTDVVSEGGYLEQGRSIEVVDVQGSRIVVRESNNTVSKEDDDE